QIILSQEKSIQKLNELVRSLREQLSECRSTNGSANNLSNLTESIIELERQQFLED
ncbi:A-type inclusion protein A25-like protein, partial [Bienertia sinuspersici]